MTGRGYMVAAMALALLAGGGWWWQSRRADDTAGGGEVVGVAGKAVLTQSMTDLDGESRHLDDWSGQIRLVNFWATWCAPCRVEMPLFQEAYERYQDRDFQIIGVALDKADAVRQFSEQLGITYPLLIVDTDTGMKMMADFANSAGVVPHSVLLSGDGSILDQHIGVFDEARLNALLEEHID